ncbi:hypothetical protein DPEC_G00341650 [Dallia pectoralis]|uniref:Uncharacterized protein n=1 Tax=Dallia pectoralis TaxID=75939 RepID=A0ACC2F5H8_DALPE|nr:hypothetical protein DPEC_G00341650 [Dallia pectoralis]
MIRCDIPCQDSFECSLFLADAQTLPATPKDTQDPCGCSRRVSSAVAAVVSEPLVRKKDTGTDCSIVAPKEAWR